MCAHSKNVLLALSYLNKQLGAFLLRTRHFLFPTWSPDFYRQRHYPNAPAWPLSLSSVRGHYGGTCRYDLWFPAHFRGSTGSEGDMWWALFFGRWRRAGEWRSWVAGNGALPASINDLKPLIWFSVIHVLIDIYNTYVIVQSQHPYVIYNWIFCYRLWSEARSRVYFGSGSPDPR